MYQTLNQNIILLICMIYIRSIKVIILGSICIYFCIVNTLLISSHYNLFYIQALYDLYGQFIIFPLSENRMFLSFYVIVLHSFYSRKCLYLHWEPAYITIIDHRAMNVEPSFQNSFTYKLLKLSICSYT